MISSSILKLWQTHVHENNFYAPQSFISYTHSHISTQTETHISLMHDGDTRAHGHLLHEDALTCSLSLSVSLSLSHTHTHTYTTKLQICWSRVYVNHDTDTVTHRHGWAWLLFTSGPSVTHIHPTLCLSPWQQILNPPPLQWQDCRIN